MKRRRLAIGVILAIVALFLGLNLGLRIYNHAVLQTVMNRVLEESANKAIKVNLHYEYFYKRETLVFDIRNLGGPDMVASLLSVLFETASRFKDQPFDSVRIAWRGRTFLVMNGVGFQELGVEFGSREPAKLLVLMARSTSLPNGKPIQSLDRQVLTQLLQAASKRARGPEVPKN